jgi:hypothetical protein
MIANEAIRNLVRESKFRQVRHMISTGGAEGLQTIEMDLARLVAAGLISMETATGSNQYPKKCRLNSPLHERNCRPRQPMQPTGPARQAWLFTKAPSRASQPDTSSPIAAESPMFIRKLPYKNLAGDTP